MNSLLVAGHELAVNFYWRSVFADPQRRAVLIRIVVIKQEPRHYVTAQLFSEVDAIHRTVGTDGGNEPDIIIGNSRPGKLFQNVWYQHR